MAKRQENAIWHRYGVVIAAIGVIGLWYSNCSQDEIAGSRQLEQNANNCSVIIGGDNNGNVTTGNECGEINE